MKGLPTYVRRDAFTGPIAESAGHFARTRRLARRIPLVANVFASSLQLAGGSREHYFHFLVGYLLPLVHAQSKHRFDTFLVLDCGPLMTPLLRETLSRLGCDFRIVTADEIERPVAVDAWDYRWSRGSDAAVRNTMQRIREAWRHHACPCADCPRIGNLLLRRSSPHPFYLDGRSEISGYGTSRRGITNMEEVSDFLARNGVEHAVYEPGVHGLGCQIEAFTAARRVIGFRGAEWANLIWSEPSVRVRMLDNMPPALLIGGFMNRLRIQHKFAIVDNANAPEDPREALQFFSTT
ncbi:MAG: glycosyltransferase 61 family protein [bacterium]